MTFRLVIVEPAENDVDDIYCYSRQRSPQGAISGFNSASRYAPSPASFRNTL
jgi:hypothetical protein